jgi:hypothetical protein
MRAGAGGTTSAMTPRSALAGGGVAGAWSMGEQAPMGEVLLFVHYCIEQPLLKLTLSRMPRGEGKL